MLENLCTIEKRYLVLCKDIIGSLYNGGEGMGGEFCCNHVWGYMS